MKLYNSYFTVLTQIPGATSRAVAYLPSLRTFLHRLRATSTTPSTLAPTLLTAAHPPLNITTLADVPGDQSHLLAMRFEQSQYTGTLYSLLHCQHLCDLHYRVSCV